LNTYWWRVGARHHRAADPLVTQRAAFAPGAFGHQGVGDGRPGDGGDDSCVRRDRVAFSDNALHGT